MSFPTLRHTLAVQSTLLKNKYSYLEAKTIIWPENEPFYLEFSSPFHQSSSELVPNLEPVIGVSTAKELALNLEKCVPT